MSTCIALLRGINVGGHHRVPMADLRHLCAQIGLRDVRTYIQSGNVVFSTDDDTDDVQVALQQSLAERFGVATPVIVRTAQDLATVVTDGPFRAQANADPTRVHVAFLSAEPDDPTTLAFDANEFAPERIASGDRVRHLLLPHGMGRSRLAAALVARPSGVEVTLRNWRTVLRLHAMASSGRP